MANNTSTATNQKPSSGSTATTKATAASTNGAKEGTSATLAASTASTAATASTTTTTVAPAINATNLKKLPRETFTKQTPAPPNSFQAHLERLDAEKQISYLMLGASEVLPNFNVKRTHPYSFFFFKKKGYKQIFQPNKNIIVQEIKRRRPDAKPNQNNRSNDELIELLRERWPLLEPDKRYVLQKERDYRKVLLSALNPKEAIHLDEMSELAANPHAQGLAMSMSTNASARKRSIGDVSNPARSGMSTLGSVAASHAGGSYYATSNKRRASTSSLNDSSSGSTMETMLIQAANECAGKLSYTNLANTIESLKKERFDLQMQKLPLVHKHIPPDIKTKLIDNRIQEISDSIVTYETKMSNGVVTV